MVAIAGSVPGDRSDRAKRLFFWLLAGLAAVAVLSIGTGASGVSVLDAAQGWMAGNLDPRDALVLKSIRLPRLALGMLIGAALAVSGAVMQGLFRNPLADPGVVGVGAGASLGAVFAIVLGGMLPVWMGQHAVSLMAFAGAGYSTLLLYRVATRSGRTSVATMLLAGIALGALAAAMVGVMTYMADDRQLRDLTFWGMGSLAGASWTKVGAALPLILPAILLSPLLARGLNGLALGEAAAGHMGLPVQRIKLLAILTVAAATGASVAVSGGIGFIGIVVPHLLRIGSGPDHRWLLPNAAVLGAILLCLADIVARMIVAPAELPIGIVTAILGAPVFLWILLSRKGVGAL
ncbi:FecCD family ABC transporter permease [Falsirhodobacter xinxiangensis]|uniref:FecCD family ABC transporter permease n=1 Tax=Falsirhodobacter xinxiangensis TaxID=2530049 RepID=UPI0010AAAFB5|nr:iron ABC transporter permease [Rhodobacter xinxiangensis]